MDTRGVLLPFELGELLVLVEPGLLVAQLHVKLLVSNASLFFLTWFVFLVILLHDSHPIGLNFLQFHLFRLLADLVVGVIFCMLRL